MRAVPQEHEELLEERKLSKTGSKVRLVGPVPPYQLWCQADIEAGARKAAQQKALLARTAQEPGLELITAAAVEQVGRSFGRRAVRPFGNE